MNEVTGKPTLSEKLESLEGEFQKKGAVGELKRSKACRDIPKLVQKAFEEQKQKQVDNKE
jgi:hypothetical protein